MRTFSKSTIFLHLLDYMFYLPALCFEEAMGVRRLVPLTLVLSYYKAGKWNR